MKSFLDKYKIARSLMVFSIIFIGCSLVAIDFAEAERRSGGSRGGARNVSTNKDRGANRNRNTNKQRSYGGSQNKTRQTRRGTFSDGGFGGGLQRGRTGQRTRDISPAQREQARDKYQSRDRSKSDDRSDRTEARQDGSSARTETRQQESTKRTEMRTDAAYQISKENNHHGWGNNNWWVYDNHHDHDLWVFASGLALGAAIANLPSKHEIVYVYGTTYYYTNGIYYLPAPAGGYQVAYPPAGTTVEHAPSQTVNVYVNDQEYGYANGVYYEPQPSEKEGEKTKYKVIKAPIGATVDTLPEGTEKINISGNDYLVYGDNYYQAFYSGSTVIYKVIEVPN